MAFSATVCFAQSFEMSPVDVHSEDAGPIRQDSVFKSEKVNQEKFSDPSRRSLADLVKDQVGVDAQTYCANCGAKRLTINGLKGEHTSILVDGIPLHSAVSSFYGVDTVPLLGISDVEVMRGAGASLTNPEAIGGTLNIVTTNPLDFTSQYSTSVSVDDRVHGKSQNHSLLSGTRNEEKTRGLVFGSQFSRTETWDVDQNNISESPQRENFSVFTKGRALIGDKHDINVRLGYSQLEILGGYWKPKKPDDIRPTAASETSFEDGSVEKKYLGDNDTVTDWIDINRREIGVNGHFHSSETVTTEWKLGYARQHQKAIYQHGFDYTNIDNMFVADTHVHWAMEGSILKVGAFFKDQRLRSDSQKLFVEEGLPEDSFDYQSVALYSQYSMYLSNDIDLDFALRLDQIKINWLDLDNEINEEVLAPRFQYLQRFNDHLSQRFSYGLGYRAPLTFFESQHGNQENGYVVDIEELEKAHSAVYSLSYNTPEGYITGGLHYTHLQNMAFGFEEARTEIKYRNDNKDYDIYAADLLLGYKPFHDWLLELTFEKFQYQDGYKSNLPTAAIEERVQLRSNFEHGKFSHLFALNFVGWRDLTKYGRYSDHYKTQDVLTTPDTDPDGWEKKKQTAPAFFTLDTSVSYEFTKSVVLSLGVNNVFDFTQASTGDTPSTWHWHFVHAHYDGLHTWGPNQGRQYFLQLSGEF